MTANDRAARTTPVPAFAEKDAPAKRHTLRLTPTALCGGLILLFWIIVALIGPVIAPFGEGDIVSVESFKVVDEAGFLGTDYLGRDLLSRIIYGARMTLGLAMIATLLSFSTGIALGFVAAIVGGWLDQILSRAVDAIMAFPSIMLALIIIGVIANNYVYLHDLILGRHGGAIFLGWIAGIGIVVTLIMIAAGAIILLRSEVSGAAE